VANPRSGPLPWYEFVHRLVAGFLLSGDIHPKHDRYPNRTDMERLGKRSNFNPMLCDQIGRMLIAGKIIEVKSGRYVPGPNAAALDAWDLPAMQEAFRLALITFIGEFTPSKLWRPTAVHSAGFLAFLTAVVKAFRGLALEWDHAGDVVAEFSKLPDADLRVLVPEADRFPGSYWFDKPGQAAFFKALSWCGVTYFVKSEGGAHKSTLWLTFAEELEVLLGVIKPKRPEPFAHELTVQSDLSLVVGSDIAMESLGILLRGCDLTGKGKVLTMKLDKARIDQMRADKKGFERFRSLLEESGALPSTLAALLTGSTPITGSLTLRLCSALVKVDNDAFVEAVRKHPRLKGYLEAGAPPSYLLIKSTSNVVNFFDRCRECGFDISVAR